jgi:hypothetical protein
MTCWRADGETYVLAAQMKKFLLIMRTTAIVFDLLVMWILW